MIFYAGTNYVTEVHNPVSAEPCSPLGKLNLTCFYLFLYITYSQLVYIGLFTNNDPFNISVEMLSMRALNSLLNIKQRRL